MKSSSFDDAAPLIRIEKMTVINVAVRFLPFDTGYAKRHELRKEEINTMRSITRPVHLTSVFYCGLVVFCCASATLAAPADVLRDLGALGDTYSFRMGIDNVDRVMSQVFTPSNAVQQARLSSISGGGNSSASGQGRVDGLAVSFDNGGQLVAYAYRVQTAVGHTTMFGTSEVANAAQSTSDGAYSYSRDIENNLWWAVPG